MFDVLVYYTIDSQTLVGTIKAVAPAPIPSMAEYASFRVKASLVEDILNGKRSPSHYCVLYGANGVPVLKLREEFGFDYSFMVPYLSTMGRAREIADIIVELDRKRGFYLISMSKSLCMRLWSETGPSAVPEKLRFYIVAECCPGILLDRFSVEIRALSKLENIDIRARPNLPASLLGLAVRTSIAYAFREI